jgi:putative transcriptional regulator
MAARVVVFAAAGLLAAWLAPAPAPVAAAGIAPHPAPGKLLVAARGLPDPNFDRTVVLLLDYGPEGALGVIVNRPTEMKLALLLPDADGITDRADVVYEGGPVMPAGMLLLLRSDEEIEDAREILDGVLATSSRDILEQRIARGFPTDRLRVYFGYAGWGPGQLDAEIARHDWLVLSGDADAVFDASPSEVWPRLIHHESDRVASLGLTTPHLRPRIPRLLTDVSNAMSSAPTRRTLNRFVYNWTCVGRAAAALARA